MKIPRCQYCDRAFKRAPYLWRHIPRCPARARVVRGEAEPPPNLLPPRRQRGKIPPP